MKGGGCPLPKGATVSCPAAGAGFPKDAWKPGGDSVSQFFLSIIPAAIHSLFMSKSQSTLCVMFFDHFGFSIASSISGNDCWVCFSRQGCCETSATRGPHLFCNETCAQSECEAAGKGAKESWYWRRENYSSHPYECCNRTVPPLVVAAAVHGAIKPWVANL